MKLANVWSLTFPRKRFSSFNHYLLLVVDCWTAVDVTTTMLYHPNGTFNSRKQTVGSRFWHSMSLCVFCFQFRQDFDIFLFLVFSSFLSIPFHVINIKLNIYFYWINLMFEEFFFAIHSYDLILSIFRCSEDFSPESIWTYNVHLGSESKKWNDSTKNISLDKKSKWKIVSHSKKRRKSFVHFFFFWVSIWCMHAFKETNQLRVLYENSNIAFDSSSFKWMKKAISFFGCL